MYTGSVLDGVSRTPREGGLHGGLSLTRCELAVTSGSSDSPGGWLHTSKTLFSDWTANSAVSAAARLTCCAARLALSLSFSSLHALWPHAFRARYPPSARAWSLTTCVHASVPTTSTSAPCTVLAWMKPTSPEGAFPKPKPLSTNHLSTISFTTLVRSVTASFEAGFALLVFELGAFSFQPLQPPGCHVRLDVEFSFPDSPETRSSDGSRAALCPIPGPSWPGCVSHRPP